jgi:hypothetical protein
MQSRETLSIPKRALSQVRGEQPAPVKREKVGGTYSDSFERSFMAIFGNDSQSTKEPNRV